MVSNPSVAIAERTSCRNASFPVLRLMEISQALVALTTIRLPGSAIALRAEIGSLES